MEQRRTDADEEPDYRARDEDDPNSGRTSRDDERLESTLEATLESGGLCGQTRHGERQYAAR
jgi:hypothetical protein